ncbi:MAG TPA: hypothetical protein VGA30_02850 [Actinomycetota bacterium]
MDEPNEPESNAPGESPQPDLEETEPTEEVGGSVLPWALFVLALAAALTFAWLWHQAGGTDRQRDQVQSVSTQFLTALTNFKAATIDADVARIKSYAVGDFRSQVDQVFGAGFFDRAKQAEVVSTGKVQSVFVEAISGANATVFGVVDETFRNASSSQPQLQVVRFDITLIKTADGWKVENVQLFQSAPASPLGQ